MFDKETFRCVGTNANFEGKIRGSATCESTDGAGNKRLASFSTSDGKTTREQIAGTGKYEGMVINSTTIDTLGPVPDHQRGDVSELQPLNRHLQTEVEPTFPSVVCSINHAITGRLDRKSADLFLGRKGTSLTLDFSYFERKPILQHLLVLYDANLT